MQETQSVSPSETSQTTTIIHNNSDESQTSDINENIGIKLPCVWCQRPRFRNDLCNRCRQKVESRARKMMQQKLIGDIQVFRNVIQFLNTNLININNNNDSNESSFPNINNLSQYNQFLSDILPFLVCLNIYICFCFI